MPTADALKEREFLARRVEDLGLIGPTCSDAGSKRRRNASVDLNYFSSVRAETKMSHARTAATHGQKKGVAKRDRALRYGASSSVQKRAGPCRRDGPLG